MDANFFLSVTGGHPFIGHFQSLLLAASRYHRFTGESFLKPAQREVEAAVGQVIVALALQDQALDFGTGGTQIVAKSAKAPGRRMHPEPSSLLHNQAGALAHPTVTATPGL